MAFLRHLVLALVAGLLLTVGLPAAAAAPVAIQLGHSVLPLNGPWKFAVGDDPRRADPAFDDATWGTVDLTPAPGAHDSDVGLRGYVPGWTARGHKGYAGFAWYRLRVRVSGPEAPLALTGPTDVDSAYQLYANGRLLGGSGDFSGAKPRAYSVQPRAFPLPPPLPDGSYLIAIRAWMGPGGIGTPDIGGVHVAPQIGGRDGIAALHRDQWLQTFEGYVVDAVQPILLGVLTLLALALAAGEGRDRPAWLWLAAALILLALLRANQPLLFWTQAMSQVAYSWSRHVILTPLTLGAWTLAWRRWFRVERPRALAGVVVGATLLYMAAQLLSRPWFLDGRLFGAAPTFHLAASGLRLVILAGYLWAIVRGATKANTLSGALALAAALFAGVALFAEELSAIHVKGIWFPWGVGVSRTQYACAGMIVVIFALILAAIAGRGRKAVG